MSTLYYKHPTKHTYVGTTPYVKDGGKWKQATNICIKINGNWFCNFKTEYSCNLFHYDGPHTIKFDDGYISSWVVDPTTNEPTIMKKFFPEYVKNVDQKFGVGNGKGSMLDSSAAGNHYINIWVVEGPSGEVDYMTQRRDSPSLPTGWSVIAYAGAIYRDRSSIRKFSTRIEGGVVRVIFGSQIACHRYAAGPLPRTTGGYKLVQQRPSYSAYFPNHLTYVTTSERVWCDQVHGLNQCTHYNWGSNYAGGQRFSSNHIGAALRRGSRLNFANGLQQLHQRREGTYYTQGYITSWYFGKRECDPRIVLSDPAGPGTYNYVDNTSVQFDALMYKYKTGSGASAKITVETVPPLTKNLTAPWAAGDNAGALHGSGVIQNHYINVWVIRNSAGTLDYMSAFTDKPPTPPTGWTTVAYAAYVYFSNKILPFTTRIEQGLRMLEYSLNSELTIGSGRNSTMPIQYVTLDVSRYFTHRMKNVQLTPWWHVRQAPGKYGKFYGISSIVANNFIGEGDTIFGLTDSLNLTNSLVLQLKKNDNAVVDGSIRFHKCTLLR